MRIALLGPAYPYRGGIALHTNLLFKAFQKKNDVKIFNFKRLYPNIIFPGKTQFEKSKRFADTISKRLIDIINPFSWYKTAKEIVNYAPDLIIIQFWMPFFAPAYGVMVRILQKKLKRAKIVAICHNVVPHEGSPFDKLLTKFLFNKIDGFIVQSKSVIKDLKQLVDNPKYVYNPHPIYDVFGEPLNKEIAKDKLSVSGNKIILFFGYIRKYKGVKYLIKSMPKVLEKNQAKLMIIGEFYDDKSGYIELIDKLNLSDAITINDHYVPDDEVNQYFSAADILVLPYVTATQSGITQIALNYQLPCVVTNVGGLPEVVEHGRTGFVVEKEDPAGISDAIIKYFTQTDREQMSANIKTEKEKYSWEKMVHKILALHEQVSYNE